MSDDQVDDVDVELAQVEAWVAAGRPSCGLCLADDHQLPDCPHVWKD